LRNIVGQTKSSLDFGFVMDQKRILLANLSKGKIGEDKSNLLGSTIVTKMYLAALERQSLPEEMRRDFYLYIDEFQSFSTDIFPSILSEARKYRLNLTIAHQYLYSASGGHKTRCFRQYRHNYRLPHGKLRRQGVGGGNEARIYERRL